MNVLAGVNDSNSPARAMSLAAMIAEQPEVTRVGIGSGYSCLTPWGTFIVTPDAATPSTTRELDMALKSIVQQWVRDMTAIGLAPLVMTMSFEKDPAEKVELSCADAAALFEALAAPMCASGLDPTWGTYIVSLARRRPGDPLEIVSVATAPECGEVTRSKLIVAARKWLTPRRRSAFKSITQLHLETNAASVWETAGGPLVSLEAAKLDLLGVPAAGTA